MHIHEAANFFSQFDTHIFFSHAAIMAITYAKGMREVSRAELKIHWCKVRESGR